MFDISHTPHNITVKYKCKIVHMLNIKAKTNIYIRAEIISVKQLFFLYPISVLNRTMTKAMSTECSQSLIIHKNLP